MTWTVIDDGFPFHPKVMLAGNEAIGAFVRMLAWSNRGGTDGVIPGAIALVFAGRDVLDVLVRVGLLEIHNDGWIIHDFHDFQQPSAEWKAKQKAISATRSVAGKKGNESRWGARRDSQTTTVSESQGVSQTTSQKNIVCESPLPSPFPLPSLPRPDQPRQDIPERESRAGALAHTRARVEESSHEFAESPQDAAKGAESCVEATNPQPASENAVAAHPGPTAGLSLSLSTPRATKRAKVVRHMIPPDWRPSLETVEWCHARGVDAYYAVDKFVLHWQIEAIARPGWDLSFLKWVAGDIEKGTAKPWSPPPAPRPPEPAQRRPTDDDIEAGRLACEKISEMLAEAEYNTTPVYLRDAIDKLEAIKAAQTEDN